jgi:hypothetical protein
MIKFEGVKLGRDQQAPREPLLSLVMGVYGYAGI